MTKLGLVVASMGAVILWKSVALLPLLQGDSVSGRLLLIKFLLAMAGTTYLVCGLVVFLKIPGRASTLFVAFCICAGLHWGGPIEMAQGQLATGLILLYVLISSILGETLFLQLALHFPKEIKLVGNLNFIRLLYVPLCSAVLLAVLSLSAPESSAVQEVADDGFWLLHMLISNLFPVAVLILFISYLVRKDLTSSEKPYMGLMVGGMLLAWVPYTIASSIGVETDPWNLTVVAIPVTFAMAFFAFRRQIPKQ